MQIQPPKGTFLTDEHLMRLLNKLNNDDEFFNITCHIDPNLQAKIAKGEYVDLERLLPKDPAGPDGNIDDSDESKVELVSKGGHMYFKPIQNNQINGLHKWEQAFRVYAAIYTQNNPDRACEIWQYMHVINVAASAYQWSNMLYYDITLTQLMAYKPSRSWAKTYHQGWNLAMKEPIGISKGFVVAPSNNHAQMTNQADQDVIGGMIAVGISIKIVAKRTKMHAILIIAAHIVVDGIMVIIIAGKDCKRREVVVDILDNSLAVHTKSKGKSNGNSISHNCCHVQKFLFSFDI